MGTPGGGGALCSDRERFLCQSQKACEVLSVWLGPQGGGFEVVRCAVDTCLKK